MYICRLPEVCAQLGLPAEQIMSDKGPHLLLCAALLAAPSALSWGFHKAAAAVMKGWDSWAKPARRSPAAVLTAGSGLAGADGRGSSEDEQMGGQQQGGEMSLLRLSYSSLPLVWAGAVWWLA